MPAGRPGQNAPDLGFPKRQLLLVAKVQGHILSIIHQGLGTSMAGDRPLPAEHRPSGHDPLCGRGPSPSPLSRPLGVQRRPEPRLPHPSPSSSSSSQLLPALRKAPSILAITLPSPASPRPYLLHPSQSPHLEPTTQPPAAPLAAEGLGCLAGSSGGRGVGRSPSPRVQPPRRSPVGAGRAGPRAQSPVGEVGSAARAGAGLGGVPLPRARWEHRLGEKADAQCEDGE